MRNMIVRIMWNTNQNNPLHKNVFSRYHIYVSSIFNPDTWEHIPPSAPLRLDRYLFYSFHFISSLSAAILCREIVDHPYITVIPANSFRGITSNALTV